MSMKVVTKRRGKEPPIKGAMILQQTISDLRGPELVPKGVYRFSTFKEADEWMIEQMIATHEQCLLEREKKK